MGWAIHPRGSWRATATAASRTSWLDALPILSRGSALRFFLTRLYDWLTTPAGALVVKKDPLEYLKKLRFHQAVDSVQDYGLAA